MYFAKTNIKITFPSHLRTATLNLFCGPIMVGTLVASRLKRMYNTSYINSA